MNYQHRLDKNEQPHDVPDWLKMQVLQKAMNMDWNRYPALEFTDIEKKIAKGLGINGHLVLLGSGSATFITTMLNFFGMQGKQIVIAQPSYSLFDYHCKTYGIDYTPWMLNTDLEYDETLLPELQEGSVLFVVSPNNPVGNTIPKAMLRRILSNHPKTLIVLDAVYAAFQKDDFSDLMIQFNNLLVMRSFSKELPVAGLRLGYVCGDEKIIEVVIKLMLPFSINPLSLAFARYMIFEPEFCNWASESRGQMVEERERLQTILEQNLSPKVARVYASSGNFLLIKIYHDEMFTDMLQAFEEASIKVLDTSTMPMLRNCIRVSIGNYHANNAVIECLMDVLMTDKVIAR
ncbi:MAG TPA: histidinol-phosphate transaminase [Flavipsychrobacter sp.]|nr:histidinol-phosphate transaminase [Flavipsychrobacter sp.]